MATLSEMVVQVLTARLTKKEMTLEEMQKEMTAIANMIKGIEGEAIQAPEPTQEEPAKPQKVNLKKVFKDKEVVCLLCNKGFTTLKRHLAKVHNISDKEYKKQFGIPSKQPLVAKAYSEARKQSAIDRGLGDILAKARETRMSNLKAKKEAGGKAKGKAGTSK